MLIQNSLLKFCSVWIIAYKAAYMSCFFKLDCHYDRFVNVGQLLCTACFITFAFYKSAIWIK